MTQTNWRQLHGNAFEHKRTLVTGGAGFIGSHLAEAMVDLGAHVTVLDDLSGGDVSNLDSFRKRAGDRLVFIQGSILDQAALKRAMGADGDGCDVVFHQAAWGSVPRSMKMPVRYHETNTTGTLNVLEMARLMGDGFRGRVVFASSSSVYGDSPTLPKVETMPMLPKSPYAATKASCEALIRAYASGLGVDAVSLRYFNIFGPRQNANSAYAAVIAAFARTLHAGGRPVIFGDGEQSRDFTFVANAVHANLLAARADQPLGGEAMNIACGDRITVNQLARDMAALMNRADLEAQHIDERAGDVKHSLADLGKARQLIGYEPIVAFDEGLKQTVAWYEQSLAASA